MQKSITMYYLLICASLLISAFYTFADVNCVIRGDEAVCTWTGNPLPEGGDSASWEGGNTSIFNTNGQYTCENCVNMSPDECLAYKSQILRNCNVLDSGVGRLGQQLSIITNNVFQLQGIIVKYQMVDYDSVMNIPCIYRDVGENASDFASRYQSYIIQQVNEWLENNGLEGAFNFDYVPVFFGVQVASTTAIYNIHNALLGSVRSGIEACQNLAFDMSSYVSRIDDGAYNMRNYLSTMGNTISSIRSNADSVTCDTCILGSTNSAPSSGSQGGALEILDPMLRDILAVLGRIETKNKDILDYLTDLRKDILNPIRLNLAAISNYLGRADSYLHNSFSNQFYSIVLGVGSYSNVLHKISGGVQSISNETVNINLKLQLFNSLVGNVFESRLDETTQGSTPSYDGTISRYSFLTNRYLSESVSGGRSTNWFERIEILLASLVFQDDGTNANVASSYQAAHDSYSSHFGELNSALSSGETEVGQSLQLTDDVSQGFLSLLSTWNDSLSGSVMPSSIQFATVQDGFGGEYSFEMDTSFISATCEIFRLVCRFVYIISSLYLVYRLLLLFVFGFNKIRLWFFDVVQVLFQK